MEPLKSLFSPELVGWIGLNLARQLPDFDRAGFEGAVLAELPKLELKERSNLIARHLDEVLPRELAARFAVIRAMLHPDEDAQTGKRSDAEGLRGWAILPLCAVVGQCGLPEFEAALQLLKEMTKRFSAEFDVRPFLRADQDRALRLMRGWVLDPNPHVRRLVSEGTRPRLPWAMRLPGLIADPTPLLPILQALRDDDSDYVRRSVANSLNDIAKDHPDLVADLAADWLRGAGPSRQRLVRHACRSLIKSGHPGAMRAFGLAPPQVELVALRLGPPRLRLGQALEFEVELRSTSADRQDLVIDYVLHLCRQRGPRSQKVFKWKRIVLAGGETVTLTRTHGIVPVTTRRYYAGLHGLSLRINGKDNGLAEFQLEI
ncbi:MAG: DNA alkylation repair protein [Tabrizicola sp.]|nr:DNA alkylation repair protein [Tabrizicola sp.]